MEKLNDQKLENEVLKNKEVLGDFEEFKSYLGKKVSLGEKLGMDEEQLANAAQKVGDFLAKKESPQNSEEQLLQELWKVGTEEEKHMLSHMLVRLVK
ncbi:MULTISPECIES: DUF3243 domain-containing protein [unclassified Bacillus (in: firmicutes)]|uniref:DUF3243 domain-containing protein n=1 Tax=unclassified Bacillus (in: firmicutes) TaxID=185979 RepID=UPI0008DF0EBA|nr:MULTISPECIES: DUF3243 domain-containing protein [unclassified Bacillus (in: firmicutes)]SFA89195.1 Protein of unknown function [Bacillus sp. UNCCL13]SFQ84818.1 Protein of unknown function [Bacillus sp. cl95]